ncbi:DUF2922 domain-containing protein [Staphylococcus haemolyticus]|uniref:DUF2922 domain-containing protein n=1 Tax=Staphylococcus haemolyticus TaxID=1283 RepID=UPI0028FE8044|nr:DUF2922 domain-containing protein [Staphylococcus haemolyticus]MDU0423115.1 DUF2922 domain-containing protein [Staphylococcus haemolyticus]MDU0439994.1 DUF2922 domain-containing protein [Staphylococcus haemolyticus]MDU0442222.1 DUF2922 domain-containing protein [Staphylococcus haemolyticus]MDU0445188.1 DUF2922 domain-containing protein [Staphylococcus haemolyticus]MDU0449478.1 DUF2922 domain-containing protein [Staphylococcus haemolyticus]
MSKTLELAFKTNLNKTAKLQFPQVNVAVSEADAKAAMDNIIKLNILQPTAGTPIKAASAKLIDVTSTTLFETK